MTAMSIAFLRATGIVAGALTTTVAADAFDLSHLDRLELPIRAVDKNGAPSQPGQPVMQRVVVEPREIEIATLTTDFTQPDEAFGWRVQSVTTPDGQVARSLTRVLTVGLIVTCAVNLGNTALSDITLVVPRIGTVPSLEFQIRDTGDPAARPFSDAVTFGSQAPETVIVTRPGNGPYLVIVTGYQPHVVKP